MASAGIACRRVARSMTTPNSMASTVEITPGPNVASAATPAAAASVHTTGNSAGRWAQGQTSACANISNAITMSGGKNTIRIPVAIESR